MTSSRPNTQRSTFSPKYNDPAANLVIISEDGVKFRINSYYLKAYSTALRNMLEQFQTRPSARDPYDLPSTQYSCDEAIPIELPSEDLEIIIDIMTTGTTPHPVRVSQWVRLAEWAHKFDCEPILPRIIRDIKEKDNIAQHPWKVFCLAAKLENTDLAVCALQNMQHDKHLHGNTTHAHCGFNHRNYSSPLHKMPQKYWMACGEEYFWGFMKSVAAYEDVGVDTVYDWNAVASHFVNSLPKYKVETPQASP